jgi:hypothetical protein
MTHENDAQEDPIVSVTEMLIVGADIFRLFNEKNISGEIGAGALALALSQVAQARGIRLEDAVKLLTTGWAALTELKNKSGIHDEDFRDQREAVNA